MSEIRLTKSAIDFLEGACDRIRNAANDNRAIDKFECSYCGRDIDAFIIRTHVDYSSTLRSFVEHVAYAHVGPADVIAIQVSTLLIVTH